MGAASARGPGKEQHAFVSFRSKEHGYRALRSPIVVEADEALLPQEISEMLGVRKGNEMGVTLHP